MRTHPLFANRSFLNGWVLALLIVTGISAFAAPPDLTNGGVPNTTRYTNLGPTGLLGWAYHEGADSSESRQIRVQAVDAGSPAAGQLAVGDVILGADGTGATPVNFTADARQSFSNAINDAEALTPALLKVLRWRAGTTTTQTLTLRTMGAYSATAPYNCPKSAKILEEGLQAIMTGETAGAYSFGTLALLAGNNPANPNNAARQLRVQTEARALIPNAATIAKMTSGDLGLHSGLDPWKQGHELIVLTEYYLRTNDALVLPAIDAMSKCIGSGQNMFGGYAHRYTTKWRDGSPNGPMRSLYGTVNNSSMLGWLGLLLTKECGVTHPDLDPAIARASRFYGYYAGKGTIPYGEHDPYAPQHDNNGKSGLAALCFELESTRTTEQKMFAKMAVAATSERDIGHTGPYFNYVWSPLGAAAGGETAATAHFNGIRWILDLNRRWNGKFVYDSLNGESANNGGSYSGFSMSTPALLTYALPLRQLHITGRGHDSQRWLTPLDVADAVAVDGYTATGRSTSQLVADLGSWSPRAQRSAAEELGNRPNETAALLPSLHAMAIDPQGTSRSGACFALGAIGDASSAGILASLLTDSTNLVRFAATIGLTNMPQLTRQPHLNTVLAAAASNAAPLLPLNEEDPAHLTHALFGALLFKSSGMVPADLTAVDKNLLYPAIRAVASNPVGFCRSSLSRIYDSLNQTDYLALADAVVYSAYELAPADKMFAYGDRLAAQRLLERFNAAEGAPLSVLAVKDDMFGGVTPDALGTLELYAGGSKTVRPEPGVEAVMDFLIQSGTNVAEAQAVLAAIAGDPNPAPLVPLKSIQSVIADSPALTLPTNLTTLRTTSNDYAKGDSIYTWRKIHGAGNVTFTANGTANSKNTNVIFDGTPGKYLFEVKMSDSKNLTEVFSTVAVTLNNSGGTLPANTPPVANSQSPSVPQATATPITLTGSDPEGYALNYRVTSQPTNGKLTGNAPYLVYTSDYGYTGSDSFMFEAMDSDGQTSLATVNLTVTPASSFPAAIYEPFNYTAGGLNGKTGASEVGFNGAWAAPSGSNVVAGSLAYNSLPILGGSIGSLTSNYGGRRLISTTALSSTGLLNDGSTLWFSVVMGHGAFANTGSARLGFALANSNFDTGTSNYNIVNETPQLGSGLGVTLGSFAGNGDQTAGKFVATHFRDSTSGSGSSGNVFGTVPRTMIGVSQQRLIVGKITWGAASDKLEIFEPDANLNLGPVTSTLTVNVNQSTFDTLTWRRGDVVTMDEIRFGSNYSSVLNGNALMTADAIAPGPGLMVFHQAPNATGPASISMVAAEAYDPNGVEYYFTCTAGGGDDSGWQDSPNYTDTGLTPGVLYSYTVSARDKSPAKNATLPSAAASATISTQTTLPNLVNMQRATAETIITTIGMTVGSVTLTYDSGLPAGTVLGQTPVGNQTLPLATVVALVVSGGDTIAPTPNPATFAVAPAATNSSIITMTATTGSDPSGVEYLFTETSGNPGSSSSTWQDSPIFTDSGLSAATQYTYTVTLRDKSSGANPTAASASSSATTNSIPAALTWFWDGGSSNIPTIGNGASAGGNGTWNNLLLNWDVGNVAHTDWNNTANKTAVFGGTAGTVSIGGGGVTVGSVQFTTASYIINGDPLTVSGAGPILINVAATIQSVLAGNVGLTKSGTGTLTLSAANTYTGTTTITGGTLSGNVPNFLPTNSNVIVNTGGTFSYGVAATYTALNVALNGGSLTGADFGTIIPGTFTLGAGTTSTISNGGRNANFSGNFTGTGNLNSTAAGNRYFLSGINNYSGTTRLTGVTGNVVFTKPSALYNSVQANWTPANITVNSGAILGIRGGNGTTTGFDSTQINTLLSNLSSVNNNGLLAGSLVNIDTTAAAFDYTGVIRDSSGPGGGSVGVYLTPGNTLTLSGANTYTGKTIYRGYFAGESTTLSVSSFNSVFTNATLGTVRSASSSLGAPTTVANGTIHIGSDSAQVDSYLTYTGAGETTDRVLHIAGNSSSDTIISQSGSGLLKFTSSFTKPSSNPTPLTLAGSGNGEIAGGIPALGNLTKSGSGTWTLSGTNTYTGTTSVTGGTLACASAASLGGGALNINTSAKLQLNFAGTRQVASLQFNSGTALANGTYGSTASTATNKNDTYFAGTGTVTVGPLAAVTTTTLALTGGSTPSTLGATLTFTATVTGSTPTGNVTFFAGTTPIGTSALNGSFQASLTTTTLPIGSYQITARYNSDVNHQSSTSAALAIQVTDVIPSTPTNLLAAPLNTRINLTWTASSNATSYAVKRSQTNGGPYTVIGNSATANYEDLTAVNGTTYHYVVSAINGAGESANSNQVSGIPGPQPSATTLVSSPVATGPYGTSVTFTATVSGGPATGTVTFLDGSTVLGTGTLSAGTASFTTTTLAAANHTITASYGGDTNFVSSVSAPSAYLVTPISLTITGVTASNKIYDGNATATLSGGTVSSGVISGETVTVVPGNGTFASANAGTWAVTASGYALGGSTAGNYLLSAQPTVSNGTITPRPLQLTGTRIYDATTLADAADLTISNKVSGDNLTLTGSADLVSKDVGTRDLLVNIATPARVQSKTGFSAGNTSTSFTVTLNAAPTSGNTLIAVISTLGTSAGRVTGITSTGAVWARAAQSTNSSGSTTEIWSAPVGVGAATGVTISTAQGRCAGVVIEYSGILTASAVDQIAASPGDTGTSPVTGTTPLTTQTRELWIGGIGHRDSSASLGSLLNSFSSVASAASNSATVGNNAKVHALERIINATGAASSGGTLSSSEVWSGAIATFKAASTSNLTLTGAAATNYTLTGLTGAVVITPKALTLTATPTVTTKPYDGLTTATLTGVTLRTAETPGTGTSIDGKPYTGDVVTLVLSGTFDTKDAGNGKAVTSTSTLSGANVGNYSLTQPTGLSGNITPKALTLTATPTVTTKPYDGLTIATLAGATLRAAQAPGIGTTSDGTPYTGDEVAVVLNGSFDTRDAGTAKAVTSTSTLNGAQKDNYTLTQPTGVTGDITPAELTITANNQNKTYGQTLVFGSGATPFISSGLLVGETIDSVTLTCAGGDAAAAVASYPITPSAATGVSFSAINYAINYVPGLLAVSAASTTTALTTSGSPVTYGTPVTLTATVVPVPDGGTVQFHDNALPLGSPVPLSGGQAQWVSSTLVAGSHSITATYGGTTNHTGSVAPVMIQAVDKATPTITTSPTTTDITDGQTLASSTLSGGVGSVPGTFAFTNPATVPPVGTASHGVSFTPADANNYQNAATSASVTVTAVQTPFEDWANDPAHGLTAGVNDGPLDDPDFDGYPNLIEFVLGGAPMVSSQAIRPQMTQNGGNWVFSYNRSHQSKSSTTQIMEYGDDVSGFIPLTIPAESGGVFTITPGPTSDRVEVSIPPQGAKCFGRLKVVTSP